MLAELKNRMAEKGFRIGVSICLFATLMFSYGITEGFSFEKNKKESEYKIMVYRNGHLKKTIYTEQRGDYQLKLNQNSVYSIEVSQEGKHSKYYVVPTCALDRKVVDFIIPLQEPLDDKIVKNQRRNLTPPFI